MINSIVKEISSLLVKNTPQLSKDQKDRMYKILNPDISDYIIYGIRMPEIEKIVKSVHEKFDCSYNDAVEVFRELTRTNVEEQKFAGFFFLNRFKKYFNEKTVELIREEYAEHCHTWSHCDSTCVRLLGPFLGKKGNEALAIKTINDWSESKNLWVKRASMVILLKITMMNKDFDENYVFELIEKILKHSEANYIEKGMGWLLKTCSKYKPDLIFDYLMKNKNRFSRLILRYASEKLPKYKRDQILKK
ncbi:MAG: DNA alkylation repair protein [Candidatus Lokiarchaeota archaeon]|nr:DNA alkylation repair protein [Candidatus Lokiarchaeota archaeon]